MNQLKPKKAPIHLQVKFTQATLIMPATAKASEAKIRKKPIIKKDLPKIPYKASEAKAGQRINQLIISILLIQLARSIE